MTWKLFGQIIVLIVIAALVLTVAKTAKLRMCGMSKDKRMQAMSKCAQNFSPSVTPEQQ